MRSQSFSSRDCLAPPAWELAALAGLVGVYVGAETTVGDWSHEILNVAGPVWLTSVLGLAATRMVLMNPAALWTGLFWFRVATAVYFGVGALVPFYVNLATRMGRIWSRSI
jgi:hypothetical protein